MGTKEEIREDINEISKQLKSLSDKIETAEKSKQKVWEHPLVSVMATAALAAIGWVFVATWNMQAEIREVSTRIDNTTTELSQMHDNISSINSEYAGIDEVVTRLDERMKHLEDDFGQVFVISMSENDIPKVKASYDVEGDIYTLDAPKWKSRDIIATDLKSGREYSAEFLSGEKILVPYTSNGQEVVFLGQFNKNNHWDGNCIINVYSQDKLVLIMDADYDDGQLLTYKQVLKETSASDGDIWVVSERAHKQGLNSGQTWNYSRDGEVYKEFTLENVMAADVWRTDEFLSSLNGYLVSYYSGNTANGLFNDITGDAYIVKYTANGAVRTLYKGNFFDGRFEDATGNAWYIVKSENTDYMYYKGIFEGNAPKHNNHSEFENPITIERINEIIDGEEFNCELNWEQKI